MQTVCLVVIKKYLQCKESMCMMQVKEKTKKMFDHKEDREGAHCRKDPVFLKGKQM